MKKVSLYIMLVLIISLFMVGCGNSELSKNDSTVVAKLETDQSVMVFSALSSANVLDSDVVSLTSLNDEKPLFNDRNNEVEIDMEKANSYLLMMENILADGGPIVSSETLSDRDDYEIMMTVSVKDLAGNVTSYTIYYSIILEDDVLEEEVIEVETTEQLKEPAYRGDFDHQDGENEKTEHDDRHDKAMEQFKNHKYSRNEEEIEYQIHALAVINGVEYEVLGSKEIELDDDEVEINFIVKLDENNYVKIEQEVEEDEVEYKYVVYKDGRKQTSMSFESEEENGSNIVKLTTEENGYKETYKFIKADNKTVIKYTGNGYSYTLFVTSTLDETTGELVYEYKVLEKEFAWQFRKDKRTRD